MASAAARDSELAPALTQALSRASRLQAYHPASDIFLWPLGHSDLRLGFARSQTLQSQTNHGRPACPGDCQDRVKVRVQGYDDSVLFQREREYLLIGGLGSSRSPRRVYTHIRERAGGLRRLAELPDPGPGAWLNRSGGVAFRRAVLEIGGGERQSLPNVVRLKLGIVPEKIVPVRIDRHGLHDPTHRQPHATDARLTIHLVRVPRYAIEVLHPSHSDTIRRPISPAPAHPPRPASSTIPGPPRPTARP